MNVFDIIDFNAKLRPAEIALISPKVVVAYSLLRKLMLSIQDRLKKKGVHAGDVVAVHVTEPCMYLLVCLALLRAGVKVISLPSNSISLSSDPAPKFYVSDTDMPRVYNKHLIRITREYYSIDTGGSDDQEPEAEASTALMMFLSSGTTGYPKVIGHTLERLGLGAMHRLSRDPIFMSGPCLVHMVPTSIGGFTTSLHALWAGVTLVFSHSVDSINIHKVKTLLTTPYGLQAILEAVEGKGFRFPTLERINIGGAVLPSHVMTRARVLICPMITNNYGSTEMGGSVATASPSLLEEVPNAAGYLAPEVEARIVDDAGTDVGVGCEGLILLRSPYMSEGYVGSPLENAVHFQDGWFNTGDTGKLSADRLLVVTGRQKEVLSSGDAKTHPEVVERFLRTLPGIKDAAAFTVKLSDSVEQIWAGLVVDAAFDEETARKACAETLRTFAPARFLKRASLPRNEMGKLLRQQLANEARQFAASPAAVPSA